MGKFKGNIDFFLGRPLSQQPVSPQLMTFKTALHPQEDRRKYLVVNVSHEKEKHKQ